MVKYLGKLKAGSKSDQTICLTDFFAICQGILINNEPRPKDSFSLWSILNGEKNTIVKAALVYNSGGGKIWHSERSLEND